MIIEGIVNRYIVAQIARINGPDVRRCGLLAHARVVGESPFDDEHELFEPFVTTVELAELVNESFCANERPELLAH